MRGAIRLALVFVALGFCVVNAVDSGDLAVDSSDSAVDSKVEDSLDSGDSMIDSQRESSAIHTAKSSQSSKSTAKINDSKVPLSYYRRNGFLGRIGISADYLYHKAGGTTLDGVIMSVNGALGWNWRDYAKLEVGAILGAGPLDIKGAYPIGAEQIGTQPLSRFDFSGGIALNFGFELKGGYNISSAFKAWDNALFINGGVEVAILSHWTTYVPYSTLLGFMNLFVEVEGRSALSQKWTIDYFVRGFGGASVVTIGGEDLQTSESEIASSARLWGLKVGIGGSYKIGDRAFVFVRLVSAYYNSGAGQSRRISIKPNATLNGLNAGAEANFKYPKSHSVYGGVQFGVGM